MTLFGVVGWKNSGKTGLVERLVAEMSARGHRVSTIKHAHHRFEIDRPGTDSFRHRQAGAHETALVATGRWVLMNEGGQQPDLDALLAKMEPVDLVLIEGFKGLTHPKIEVRRRAAAGPPIADRDDTVVAIASDHAESSPLPTFDLDATSAIADCVLALSGLPLRRED